MRFTVPVLLACLVAVSCTVDPGFLDDEAGAPAHETTAPVVVTMPATHITATSADVGGNVISDGGAPILARGIVWGRTPQPTTSVHEGMTGEPPGAGQFTSLLTWLASGETYYVRAYASNSVGTGYGEEIQFSTLDVEAEWDWRSVSGESYLTPVRSQGQCSSCWATAAVDLVESRIMIRARDPSLQPSLSVRQLVSCDTASNGCSGGHSLYALQYVRDFGLVAESDLPYSSGSTDTFTCPVPLPPGPRTYVVEPRQLVHTSADLKREIVTHGPVIALLDVYGDFFTYSSGVYTRASETFHGQKFVLVTGFSDSGQHWIVKNTWGTAWGESGYVRVAYECDVLQLDRVIVATPSIYNDVPLSED